MRTRIWHSDWKPRWLIRCVSAAMLSFVDKQVGDCFAYALAAVTGEPLLFKGDDFALTDIEAA